MVVTTFIAGTAFAVAVSVPGLTDEIQHAIDQATGRTPTSQRSSGTPEQTSQPLLCEEMAERYRGCLIETEDLGEDEATTQVESLRQAARQALFAHEVDDEDTACKAQFEARIEHCENRGGLLGRFAKPSTELDPETEKRSSLLSRFRGSPEPTEEEQPAEEPIDLARYQALSGCDCGGGKKGPRIELNIAMQGSKTVMGDADYEFVDYMTTDWVLTRDGEPWRLPTTMKTAPPEALPGWRSTMGFVCSGDTVVIASVRRVSAWSIDGRKLLWTAELDDPFGEDIGLGRRNAYQLSCNNLTIRRDVVEVPLDRRRKLRFGLADGARK
jgi:hypothetical protein